MELTRWKNGTRCGLLQKSNLSKQLGTIHILLESKIRISTRQHQVWLPKPDLMCCSSDHLSWDLTLWHMHYSMDRKAFDLPKMWMKKSLQNFRNLRTTQSMKNILDNPAKKVKLIQHMPAQQNGRTKYSPEIRVDTDVDLHLICCCRTCHGLIAVLCTSCVDLFSPVCTIEDFISFSFCTAILTVRESIFWTWCFLFLNMCTSA